jgi:hypothetical protein
VSTTRTVHALAVAVLVVLTTVGCGLTEGALVAGPIADPGRPSADRFEAAIEATEAEERYSFDADLAVDMGFVAEELDLSGEVDRGADPRMVVRFESAEIDAEIRIDGDDAWFSSNTPEFEDALPDDAEWIHVTGEDDIDEFDFDSPDDLGAGPLYYLRGAEDVEDLGVDGEVRTYSFTAASDVAEQAPEEHRETVRDLFTSSDNLDLTVTGEVDIDAEGRIRRLSLHGDLTPKDPDDLNARRAEGGGLDFEMRYEAFGEPVDVEAPPEDETVDAADDPSLLEAVEIQTA